MININISDNHSFCDVAYLFDQDIFLKDIKKIRDSFSFNEKQLPLYGSREWVTKLPNRYKNMNLDVAYNELEKIERKIINPDIIYNTKIETRNKWLNKLRNLIRKTDKLEDFNFEIEELRKKYSRPAYFNKLIESAIVYGTVMDSDYITCRAEIIYPEIEYPQLFSEPKMALIIYPNTRKEDIFKTWDEAKKNFEEMYANKLFPSPDKYFPKAKSQIQLHRRAYWFWIENNKNKDWMKLADKWADYNSGLEHTKTFQDAVLNYQSWLNNSNI